VTELLLETTQLTSGYVADVPIIRELDLAVPDGGAVGIVGRNGAGKSCLASTLVGQRARTGGEIRLAGRSLTAMSPRKRIRAGLALVPEGRRIFAQLTVRENLLTAAYGADRALTPEVLQVMCDRFPVLGRKLQDRAGGMSGGEQQWLAIARALVQQPRVIVLDEPSLGLSPVAVEALVEALRDIRGTGVALLLMEQNPMLLRGVCDVVHSMDRGVITQTRQTDSLGSDDDLLDVLLGVQPS
jgi:ABC-type branched-subunit amino acid transport system ATPase component